MFSFPCNLSLQQKTDPTQAECFGKVEAGPSLRSDHVVIEMVSCTQRRTQAVSVAGAENIKTTPAVLYHVVLQTGPP